MPSEAYIELTVKMAVFAGPPCKPKEFPFGGSNTLVVLNT